MTFLHHVLLQPSGNFQKSFYESQGWRRMEPRKNMAACVTCIETVSASLLMETAWSCPLARFLTVLLRISARLLLSSLYLNSNLSVHTHTVLHISPYYCYMDQVIVKTELTHKTGAASLRRHIKHMLVSWLQHEHSFIPKINLFWSFFLTSFRTTVFPNPNRPRVTQPL